MKFESKFGVGEIVNYTRQHRPSNDNVYLHDEFMEVISVSFGVDGTLYTVRGYKGMIFNFKESELEGDPDFDQETGYPPEEGDEAQE